MELQNRWEVNLSLFFHHTNVCNVKHNKGTKAEIKLQQLPSSTNKYEKGFLCLGGIQVSLLPSRSIQQRKLFSCQTPGSHRGPPPQSISDSDTMTSAALDTELLLLSSLLRTMSWGHAVETNSTLSRHLNKKKKSTPPVLWDVIENHDLAWE